MRKEMADGLYDVVEASQLSLKTSAGWRIAAILPESVPGQVYEQVLPFNSNTATGVYPGTVSTTKGAVFNVHKFLIWQDAESERHRLSEEVSRLSNDLYKNKQHLDETTEARTKMAKELEAANKKYESIQADFKQRGDEVATLKKAATEKDSMLAKLKEDFGKVWAAVGDLKMREVLGMEVENPKPVPEAERKTVYDRITSNEED